MLRWLTIFMLLASPVLAQANPPPLTWAQIESDNGTLATRQPIDPITGYGTQHDTGIYPYGISFFSWELSGFEYLGDPLRPVDVGCPTQKHFDCTSMTAWHIVYPEAVSYPFGPPKPNVPGVHVIYRNYQSWCHLKSGGWFVAQDPATFGGLTTAELTAHQDAAIQPQATTVTNGEYSMLGPTIGNMNHGWITGRGNFTLHTVDGCYMQFEVRVDQPNANLLSGTGIDWWQNNAAPYPDNFEHSHGTWLRITQDWQRQTGTSMSLATLQADPPPPLQSIAPPPPLGTATISSCLPATSVCLPWTPANLSPQPLYTFDPSTFTYSGTVFVSGSNTGSVGGTWTAESGSPVKGPALNGWPTITLDGTIGFINTTAAWPAGNVFIFAVVAVPSVQSNSLVSASWGATEGRDPTHDWVYYPRGGAAFGNANEGWVFQGSSATIITRGTVFTDTAYHIVVIKAGTSADLENNGSPVTNVAVAGAINTATSTSVRVGASGPGPSEALIGTLAYLTVLVNPTTLDKQRLTGWAAWRFGEQALLPGGYPYKPAPPCQ